MSLSPIKSLQLLRSTQINHTKISPPFQINGYNEIPLLPSVLPGPCPAAAGGRRRSEATADGRLVSDKEREGSARSRDGKVRGGGVQQAIGRITQIQGRGERRIAGGGRNELPPRSEGKERRSGCQICGGRLREAMGEYQGTYVF